MSEQNLRVHGPAVRFDPAAFRRWLEEPTEPGSSTINAEATVYVAAGYAEEDAAALLEEILQAVNGRTDVWLYGAEDARITVWRTSDNDGPDGGAAAELFIDGVPLSLGHLAAGDLVPVADDTPLPGYEAAAMALAALASRANEQLEKFRDLIRSTDLAR